MFYFHMYCPIENVKMRSDMFLDKYSLDTKQW